VNDQLALGFQYVGTRYYTSSGTFAKADPFGDSSFDGAKMRAIRVRVQAGGGGAAGCGTTGAGQVDIAESGGAGGYAESFITDIAGLGTSVTVTRGDGGAGGTGAAVGSVGGSSSFGTAVVAAGGVFGERATATPPIAGRNRPGGTASAGQLQIPGGVSGTSFYMAATENTGSSGNGGE
jgi:hypothetical protein